MKVSMICTVLNEDKNIDYFLNSIISQTMKPDEFIIVDGGSKDRTYDRLRSFSKKHKWIKVYQTKGVNIPQGRNRAIERSRNEVIVGVDAGTKYEKDWLEKLTQGFMGGVAFGQTLPLIEDDFQRVLAGKMRQRYGSSRNIIFEKKVWKAVGKYPEDLKIAEDTVFNELARRKGFRIGMIPGAVGHWEMRSTLKDLKKQFRAYGYWDHVAYKKYDILPLKSKILICALTLLFAIYPIIWLFSQVSLSAKISFAKRFEYVKGFWWGLRR